MRFMPGRFLKHNKSTETPSNLIFFDTETNSTPHPTHPKRRILTLKVGVAHYVRVEKGQATREDECVFTDSRAFWDWLIAKTTAERSTWVFAHNIAFDLTVCKFWQDVEDDLWWFHDKAAARRVEQEGTVEKVWHGTFIPEDPPTIIRCRVAHSKRTVWFVDSLNYYRCPLAEIARAHGLSKDYSLTQWAPLEHCVDYCRNDVEILKRGILSLMTMVRENDLGVWKATIAGQAFAAYRHRFMRHSILPHNDPAARKHERGCYYGGEVGVYFVGRVVPSLSREPLEPVRPIVRMPAVIQGPIYHLDVNSLYPSVMRDGHYPTQLIDIRERSSVEDVCRLPLGVSCSARVSLDAVSRPYPIKFRGQLWFGMGRMVTCLCGPELVAACRSGDVVGIDQLHLYTCAPIFRSYVEGLYQLRLDMRARGNAPGESIVKLLLNSLYGKFGQKGTALEPLPNYDCPKGWGMHYEKYVQSERLHCGGCSAILGDGEGIVEASRLGREIRLVGWNAFAVSRDSEPDQSFPAISAWVTSYGRERMRCLRGTAGLHEVLYQDTDSLHCTERGLRRLMRAGELHPTKLGKLKLVGVANEAEYRGIKSYTFDGVRTEAGLKAGAVRIDGYTVREEQFSRLGEILSAQPPDGVIVSTVDKTEAIHDVRGIVGPDGWVKPLNKVWVSNDDE